VCTLRLYATKTRTSDTCPFYFPLSHPSIRGTKQTTTLAGIDILEQFINGVEFFFFEKVTLKSTNRVPICIQSVLHYVSDVITALSSYVFGENRFPLG
jgi:hypothetical protein